MAWRNAGLFKAMQALTHLIVWEVYVADLGEPPSMTAFAKWWGTSRSQAYRDQQSFRRAFPGYDTPTELVDALLPEDQKRIREAVGDAAQLLRAGAPSKDVVQEVGFVRWVASE